MNMIRIALVYAALFATIVVAADTGWLPRFAQHLHDLPFGDKVVHFMLFGLLALFANLAFANLALASRGRRPLARAIVMGSLFVLFIATAEEYSNKFVAQRDCSLGDLTANYLGVACFGWLPLWWPQLFSLTEPAADDSATADDSAVHDPTVQRDSAAR